VGQNPDLEVGRFLSERVGYANTPATVGSLTYRDNGDEAVIGILQAYVPNVGDAWKFTLDALDQFYDRALTWASTGRRLPRAGVPPSELIGREIPSEAEELVGAYLTQVRQLGLRTAEMHVALASDSKDPAFAP